MKNFSWISIALVNALFALAALSTFEGRDVYHLLWLRSTLSLVAMAVFSLRLSGVVLSRLAEASMLLMLFSAEIAATAISGQLQPPILLLLAIVIERNLAPMRNARKSLAVASRGLKPLDRRLRDLTAELRALNSGHSSEYPRSGPELSLQDGAEIPVVPASHSPAVLVDEVIACCEQIIEQQRRALGVRKSVQLQMDIGQRFHLPMSVMIDLVELKAMLMDCIGYAIDSTSGDHGTIRISVQCGLRQIVLTVEDNGIGLSEEKLLKAGSRRMSFNEMRARTAFWGARLVRHNRLGVGSRVTLEIPRTDAFAGEPIATSGTQNQLTSSQELPLG